MNKYKYCEAVQVVTLANGSLVLNKCDKPRYHEEKQHFDADKDLSWEKQ